jgi:RHS repeat-associated protein
MERNTRHAMRLAAALALAAAGARAGGGGCHCGFTVSSPEWVTATRCDRDIRFEAVGSFTCSTTTGTVSTNVVVPLAVAPDGTAPPVTVTLSAFCEHGERHTGSSTTRIFVQGTSGRPGDIEPNAPGCGFLVSAGGNASGSPAGEVSVALADGGSGGSPFSVSLRGFRSTESDVVGGGSRPMPEQIRTAEGLMVFAGSGSTLELGFYRSADVRPDFGPDGRYRVVSNASPVVVHAFTASPDGLSAATVRDGVPLPVSTVSRIPGGFAAATAGGVTERYAVMPPSDGLERREWRTYGADGALASVRLEVATNTPSGWLVLSSTEGNGASARTTRSEYGPEGTGADASWRVRRRVFPDGSSTEWLYDARGRATNVLHRCPGFPDRLVVSSYAPFLPTNAAAPPRPAYRDDGRDEPWEPRVETEYAGGAAVRRTARAVAVDRLGRRHAEELVLDDPEADPAAAWLAGAGIRSLRVRMPEDDCRACSKRPKQEVRPDGTIATWYYGSGDYEPGLDGAPGVFTPAPGGKWFRTVRIDGCAASTNGVPYRTLRETTVEHRASRQVVLRETAVCTSVSTNLDECAYETVAWTETFLDAQNREVATVSSDGTETATAWAAGRVASRTAADGTATSYAYDADGRVAAETVAAPGRPPVETSYARDGAGRILSRTVSSGGLSETEERAYDTAGRLVRTVSRGVTNLHAHAEGGGLSSEAVVRAPGTPFASTNLAVRSADGSYSAARLDGALKSATLSRVLPGGTRATRSFAGPDGTNSPAWTETRTAPNGLAVLELRPASGGGVLSTTNAYDRAGRLVASRVHAPDGTLLSASFRACDPMPGSAVLSATDLDGDGALSLLSDRATSNETAYAKIGGAWWEVSRSWTFPAGNSAAPVPSGSVRRRLSGLGPTEGGELLLAESVATDALGNETRTLRTLDPADGAFRDIVVRPSSAMPAASLSRGGLVFTNLSSTGVVTAREYDALGRLSRAVDGRGNATTYACDGRGNLVSETDAAGATTTYACDALNRRVSSTDPTGNTTHTAYDSEDRVVARWGATCPVLYGYDACGRMAAMYTARDDALDFAALAAGLAGGASHPSLDATRWLYDEATGLLTNKLYADGSAVSYSYTPDGKLASRTWARGVATAYAYDFAGNLLSVEYSDATPDVSFQYDRLGNVLSAVVAGVSTNLYACDLLGRLTNEWQNGASIARACDALGRDTGFSLGGGDAVRYAYDALGRFSGVVADLGGAPRVFACTYLPGTDLVSGCSSDGFARTVACEPPRPLVSAVTNTFGATRVSTFACGNDAAGRRAAIARGGLASGALSGATDAYGYDARSQVTSARRTLGGNDVRGFSYDYAYDPVGNRTGAAEYDENGAPLVSAYAANELNQYTSRTVPGYAAVRGEAGTNAFVTVNERPAFRLGEYFFGGDTADNTASNVLKDLEVYAAINPPGTNVPDTVYAVTSRVFVAKTPEAFTYDADGNMTSDGRFVYTWDAENRMVMASNAEVVVTYAYDHRGRMVQKRIARTDGDPVSIAYLWDGWNIVRETRVSGLATTVTRNVWGLDLDGTLQGAGGVGGLLAVVRDDGVFLPTYDANGNVTEYVATNGAVAAHYDYSPFGEQLVATGPLADTFTHRFSTKPWCPVTGLSEYQYRKYGPEIGRWMSRDPIGELGGDNLYTIASSTITPYHGTDFSCIKDGKCGGAIGGAVWSSCITKRCSVSDITDALMAAMKAYYEMLP